MVPKEGRLVNKRRRVHSNSGPWSMNQRSEQIFEGSKKPMIRMTDREENWTLTFDLFESCWAWIVDGTEIFADLGDEERHQSLARSFAEGSMTNQFSFQEFLLFSFACPFSSIRCQKKVSQLLQIVGSSLFPGSEILVFVAGRIHHWTALSRFRLGRCYAWNQDGKDQKPAELSERMWTFGHVVFAASNAKNTVGERLTRRQVLINWIENESERKTCVVGSTCIAQTLTTERRKKNSCQSHSCSWNTINAVLSSDICMLKYVDASGCWCTYQRSPRSSDQSEIRLKISLGSPICLGECVTEIITRLILDLPVPVPYKSNSPATLTHSQTWE